MYMKQLCLLTQPCCGFLCNVLLIEQTVTHVWPSHVDIYLIGKLVKEGVASCVCDIVIERLLTLGAHALQGNSSVCVCVCVCVCGSIFPVTNQPGRPTICLSAATADLKRGFFFVKQLLSAILLALAGARAYIHSRDVTLDHVVFCYGFAIVWRDAI